MKILILSDFIENDKKACAFKVRIETALRLAAKGHKVHFVSPSFNTKKSKTKNVTKNLIAINTMGLLPPKFRRGGFGILDMICKAYIVLINDFDVVHVTNGHRPANFIPCMIAKYIKKTIIIDESWEWLGKGGYANHHSGFFGRIKACYDIFFEIFFKEFFDTVITISSTLQNRFKKSNTIVVHGGADNAALVDYPIETVRDQLNIDKQKFIIGMSNVSKFDHNDNLLFFQVFSKLIKKYQHLRLLMTSSDHDYISMINAKYNLGSFIINPGWVNFPTYNRYLSACNLFVLPYPETNINKARWPNKIGDYLCLNRPIITNPTGDVKQYFEKYNIGFLCKHDLFSYYNLMTKIIDKNIDITKYNTDSLYISSAILSFDKRIEKFIKIYKKKFNSNKFCEEFFQ